jgi:hypothetical protein
MPLDSISPSARAELAAVNVEIAAATADRAAALQAVGHLERPAAEVQVVRAEYVACKAAYDVQVVGWYEGGCIGERPEAPFELLRLEHQIGDLSRNLGAVESRLGAAQEALQTANARLGELQLRHRSALYRAAVAAAEGRLYTCGVPALISMLSEFAVIESLSTELRNRGIAEPEAMSASREIDRLILIARQSTGVRGDREPARRFLDELATTPDLEMPDPGEPVVEHLEPRTIKPMVDGSQFLNRGDAEAAEPDLFLPAWPNPATDPDGAWRHMRPEPVWGSPVSEAAEPVTDTGGTGFRPPLAGR